MLNSYKELIVWQKSVELVLEIYRLTDNFPKSEIYALTSQMRRAAVSIPSNIAEGYSRRHRQEYIQFIKVAFGSGAELETQIVVAKKLGLASDRKFERAENLLNEVMKMLNKLVTTLNPKP